MTDARPPRRYAAYFKVRHHELDTLGHVNNAVYLHYLEQAAIEHAAALGYTLERLRALGGLFLLRRLEIDYRRPAGAGEVLQVVTWAAAMRAASATRDYVIYRWPGAVAPADGLLPAGPIAPETTALATARGEWAWVDLARGRPRRIPAELPAAFLGWPAEGIDG